MNVKFAAKEDRDCNGAVMVIDLISKSFFFFKLLPLYGLFENMHSIDYIDPDLLTEALIFVRNT